MKTKTKKYNTIARRKAKAKWYALMITTLMCLLVLNAEHYMTVDAIQMSVPPVYAMSQVQKVREYAYNERVPVEVVKDEIVKISRQFKVDENLMLRIAKCESGYNNLAYNKQSSAVGVYQFLNATWENTDTWKLYHKAPTDFKVNVWEAVLAVARGELWKWNSSKSCWKK